MFKEKLGEKIKRELKQLRQRAQRGAKEEELIMQDGGRVCSRPLPQRGGCASLRRADAAQVCSNVGFVAVDGALECSAATAARQIVSERW